MMNSGDSFRQQRQQQEEDDIPPVSERMGKWGGGGVLISKEAGIIGPPWEVQQVQCATLLCNNNPKALRFLEGIWAFVEISHLCYNHHAHTLASSAASWHLGLPPAPL